MKNTNCLVVSLMSILVSLLCMDCFSSRDSSRAIERSKERPGGFLTELQTVHTAIPSTIQTNSK